MPDHEWRSPEALYARYKTNMLRRAMEYTNNMEDAEDIVSEAWISLLRHFHKLPHMEEKALSTYIMRCVQNTAIDHLKYSRKIREMETWQTYVSSENPPPRKIFGRHIFPS